MFGSQIGVTARLKFFIHPACLGCCGSNLTGLPAPALTPLVSALFAAMRVNHFSAGSPPVSSHITQSKSQSSTISCIALLLWPPASSPSSPPATFLRHKAPDTKASDVLETCLHPLHSLLPLPGTVFPRYPHGFHPFLQVFAQRSPSHPYAVAHHSPLLLIVKS